MELKELEGYERITKEEFDNDKSGLAVAHITFDDGLDTDPIYMKFNRVAKSNDLFDVKITIKQKEWIFRFMKYGETIDGFVQEALEKELEARRKKYTGNKI